MNIILIAIIAIAIFLIVILIYLLNMNKSTKTSKVNKKQAPSISVEIENIRFPRNIEKMNSNSLLKACKVIFDSFKALNYLEKSPNALDKIEWHSWQVSILMSFLKQKNILHISQQNNELFHLNIMKLDEKQINQEMQRIYKKYLENVNIDKNRDELSKDIVWTARDVSILLYKIINK